VHLDPVDLQILGLLRANGRRTVREIARLVSLSPAPVRQRIRRLEEAGVITGYTITTDEARLGLGLQAVTELRFTGDTDIHDIVAFASAMPEVDEVLTLTGDVDAVVRLHVDNVEDLQKVVNRLRRKGAGVVQTKTHIVIASWRRGAAAP
jgi:DNA-binding Lrp family transcriptional regulator